MSARELTPENLREILSGSRVLIPLHVAPDGDSIGSALAVASACRHLDSKPTVVSSDPVPTTYSFLPGWEAIRRPERVGGQFDVLLLLDCSSLSRIGRVRELVDRAKPGERPLIAVVDHHRTGETVGDYLWSDAGAAATCEMIFDWMIDQGLPISGGVATALYTGIATDTGFYAFPNTSAGTFRRSAQLVQLGARPHHVHQKVNEERSMAEIRILGRALEKMRVAAGGRVAWTEITRSDLTDTGAGTDDTEGIVNHLRSVAGTELAVIFVEMDTEHTKVSFRSREYLDVAELARNFGGGGHARAAGAKMSGSIAEVRKRVIETGSRQLRLREAGGQGK